MTDELKLGDIPAGTVSYISLTPTDAEIAQQIRRDTLKEVASYISARWNDFIELDELKKELERMGGE